MVYVKTLVFPSSYFWDSKVDEELEQEYLAALETGLFDIVLFSSDKWFHQGILKLDRQINKRTLAIYRGWMMKPSQYNSFYNELQKQGIELITVPKAYELCHIFPNVYPFIQDDTAKIAVYRDGERINLNEIRNNFSKFMVKDFVKSVKGTDFPKYFDAPISQEEFDVQMNTFYKYRGGLYTGGICIKEYLDMKKYGEHTNEYRVFYVDGKIATVAKNSGQPEYTPASPSELLSKYQNLESRYYTLDYAELSRGEWKILEAGDGQVSGLSDGQDAYSYYRMLYYCVN